MIKTIKKEVSNMLRHKFFEDLPHFEDFDDLDDLMILQSINQ